MLHTHQPTNPATSGIRLYDFQFDAKVVTPCITIRRASEVVPEAAAATTTTGDAIPAWKGSLLIGALRPGLLVRLRLADGRVALEERYLGDLGERFPGTAAPGGFLRRGSGAGAASPGSGGLRHRQPRAPDRHPDAQA